jgi:hypothetical protein
MVVYKTFAVFNAPTVKVTARRGEERRVPSKPYYAKVAVPSTLLQRSEVTSAVRSPVVSLR